MGNAISDLVDEVKAGNLDKVEAYIKSGGDVNARSRWTHTSMLDAAIEAKRPECVRFLLTNRASTTHKNSQGQTSLHLAADLPDILSLLVGATADVNGVDNDTRTPLHCAVDKGNERSVAVLMASPGIALGIREKARGQTAHSLALSKGLKRLAGIISEEVTRTCACACPGCAVCMMMRVVGIRVFVYRFLCL